MLAAVAFVAETTGTPAYLIPTLIGAAVAYAASGEASVVLSQQLRQTPKLSQPIGLRAHEIMRTQIIGAQADATLQEFFSNVAAHSRHPYSVRRDRSIRRHLRADMDPAEGKTDESWDPRP